MKASNFVPPELAALVELLDVQQVATLLQISSRHVYRLCDRGALPPPVRLGASIRWRKRAILDWLDSGCPSNRVGR